MSAINVGELFMTIGLDTKQFDSNLSSAQNKATDSGGFFKKAFEFATGGLILKGIETVGSAVGNMFSGSIEGARENARAMAQTAQVIQSTGNAAGVSTDYIANLADSLSDASGKSLFSGEQIQQASNMILTFTNIKGTVVDAATAIATDMAQALGGEPQSQAIALGKALNSPKDGITALSRVGVSFTAEQKKMIKTMQDHGNIAGAQKVILDELNKEFGGQAVAAAKASGGWVQFTARMEDAAKGIAIGLLPVFDTFTTFLNDKVAPVIEDVLNQGLAYVTNTVIPALITAWNNLQPFIQTATEYWLNTLLPALETVSLWLETNLPIAIQTLTDYWNDTLYPALQKIWAFIQDNIKPIFAALVAVILTVVVPAFVTWAAAAISAATATIIALAPVLLPLAAIGIAVFALYKAWDTNFLGIREALTNFWNVYGLPIFNTLKTWLATNLPIALQKLSDFWNNILLPALNKVWDFIKTYVIPIIVTLVTVHFEVLKTALTTVANFWTGTLWPALQKVYNFFDQYIIPVIKAIVEVHIAAMGAALRTLTGFWNDTLLPVLRDVFYYFDQVLIPAFKTFSGPIVKAVTDALGSISKFWYETLSPALEKMKDYIGVTLGPTFNTFGGVLSGIKGFFEGIGGAVSDLVGYLEDLKYWLDKVGNAKVPNKPSSSDDGPGNAMGSTYFRGGTTLVGEKGPELVSLPRGSKIYTAHDTNNRLSGGNNGTQVVNNFNLSVNTAATAEGVINNFTHMQARART